MILNIINIIQWIGAIYLVRLLYIFLRTLLPSVVCKILASMKPVDLTNRYGSWAVLTGATSGIGKAYAIELAKRKVNLVLISRSIDKLNDTAKHIKSLYPVDVKVIQVDFGSGEKIYESIENELKFLDIGILVNNVGVAPPVPQFRPFDKIPPDHLWKEITINAGATAMMTRIVLPQMKLQRRGIIVNMGSMSSRKPHPYLTNYAATKSYLQLLSSSLNAELKDHHIQVQHLHPGLISTNMTKDVPITTLLIPARWQSTLFPDATLYASWAICTLGRLQEATGYWAFDIMNLLQMMETDEFHCRNLINLLKKCYGDKLQ